MDCHVIPVLLRCLLRFLCRIDRPEVEGRVQSAIKNFKESLPRGGSISKGVICIKFYTKSVKTVYIIHKVEEKQVFETWMLPVSVKIDRSAGSFSGESVDGDARGPSVETSLDHVQRCLMNIFTVYL
jgi:hypothetical protein